MKNSVKNLFVGDGTFMNSSLRQFSMAAVSMAIMQVASAQITMTNVVPMQVPGQGTEIRVMFNGLPPQPQAYELENPSRLVLDFNDAKQTLNQTNVPVATNEASSVEVTSDEKRARLTVNLNNKSAFTTRVEGNTFILKVNNSAQVGSNTALPELGPSAVSQQQGIADIGFQRGKSGEGQVGISLLGANTPVDVQQQGSKVVVRLLGNRIPAHLIRRMNVNDFATPVSVIDAYNDGANGVITIQSSGSYEYMAYQAENKLTVSLKRPEEKKSPQSLQSPNNYTGKKSLLISKILKYVEFYSCLQTLRESIWLLQIRYRAILLYD